MVMMVHGELLVSRGLEDLKKGVKKKKGTFMEALEM
jgi:hypothetical protein